MVKCAFALTRVVEGKVEILIDKEYFTKPRYEVKFEGSHGLGIKRQF
jgi:hypothetical protein